MRYFKGLISIILLVTTVVVYAENNSHAKGFISSYKQQHITPNEAIQKLVSGNERYVSGKERNIDNRVLSRLAAKKGQAPFAFVFNCVDSRSTPEILFDQPVGALFVSRIAGNVVSPDVLGSMEFATQYAGSKLIVVMGHTQCGAVVGACSNVNEPGNLDQLLNKIRPAIQQTEKRLGKKKLNCNDKHVIDEIAKQNVLDQMIDIYRESPATARLVRKGKIKIIGAMHNIKTGKVTFFNDQGRLIN